MKEFKFTATMWHSRIKPDEKFSKQYQNFRHDLMMRTSKPYPEIEVIIRAYDPRQEWIDKWYSKAGDAESFDEVSFAFVKDGTVCISREEGDCFTVAAPRKGDKYDRKTGIAVAFAKFCGEKIPEYI